MGVRHHGGGRPFELGRRRHGGRLRPVRHSPPGTRPVAARAERRKAGQETTDGAPWQRISGGQGGGHHWFRNKECCEWAGM